jgi:hypothetical protein
LTADGSIVVLSSTDTALGAVGLGMARLDSSGNFDPSFGQHGFVRMDTGQSWESFWPSAVAVLPDGHLAVAFDYSGKSSSGELLRLLPNGTLDPMFDSTGLSVGLGTAELILQPTTGRLVLSGVGLDAKFVNEEDAGPSLMSIDSSSSAVTWRTALPRPRGADPWGTDLTHLAADPKGRVLAAGAMEWSVPSPDGHLAGPLPRADMIVIRVRAGGGIDRCFGKRGLARVHFPGKLSMAAAITVGERGAITIAGPPDRGNPKTPHRFELARLHGGACRR